MNQEVEYYSWTDMDKLIRRTARKIREENFSPNIIIGIARCGLVPATHLSYLLEIDDVGMINVRTTRDDTPLAPKESKALVEFNLPRTKIEGKSILLVDTVMASGNTMNFAKNKINEFNPREIKIAAILDWPNSPYASNKEFERPPVSFKGAECKVWPDFPWEH